MNDDTHRGAGWFEGVDRGDLDTAQSSVETGTAESPEDWPSKAIGAGFADDEEDYYEALHEATLHATREAVRERERADDQQLKHSIRAIDDCARTVNELTERVVEWAGTIDPDATVTVEYVRDLAARRPETPAEQRVVSLAERVAALDDERAELRTYIERAAPEVAPNLAALAGPVLAARLVALAGGLESLAKQPSGTVQVLGAEEALFAHLRGGADPPKHGIIYTHEAVRGTAPEHRGSAARALAGKLSIAARIDHYSGEYRPSLESDLRDRIERIQARDAT
jgi:nucleolar protein 56